MHCPGLAQVQGVGGPGHFIDEIVRSLAITTFEYNQKIEICLGNKEAYPGQWTVQDKLKYTKS